MATLFLNALGTFGIVYSIIAFHFRFLEKELRRFFFKFRASKAH
jgi:hypothetical protein